jgi:hypothetical protein
VECVTENLDVIATRLRTSGGWLPPARPGRKHRWIHSPVPLPY